MTQSKRPIFRQQALKQYMRSREKVILPRVVSPPVFACCWVLLGLLLAAGLTAWLGQIPTIVSCSGVIQAVDTQRSGVETIAYLFLPASTVASLHTGQPVRLQIGQAGPQVTGSISTIEPGIISPSEAAQRFALGSSTLQVIAQPSVVVTVQLGTAFPAQTSAGSLVQAQVQIGTRSVLSLLPGFGTLIGG